MRTPIRYFVVNDQTRVMHIFGFCPQTKKRSIPIRLFDTQEELQTYVCRPIRLCYTCQQELKNFK